MQHKYFYILGHTTQPSTINIEHLVLITLLQGLTQVEEMLIAAFMHGHHVDLLTTTWPVWLYRTCHKLTTGCHVIC